MWFGPLSWYLIISLLGWALFPLVYRLFPGLYDRGYTISRALGLLLWGYLFWLLSSLGVLVNNVGGYLFALLPLLVLSVLAWRKLPAGELVAWLKERRKTLLTAEVLFAAAFLFLLVMRGMDPAILGTEKPMELAFINAVMRSPSMPPYDPWLSGYAISYYYFGYVLVGMLANLSAVSAGVAFNLAISLVFALSAIGVYGVVNNLLAALRGSQGEGPRPLQALLGPLFVLIISNVEGFLELLHGLGVGWQQNVDGSWQSSFWRWLNLQDLINPPAGNTALGELRHWWWWRASRVVTDLDMRGDFWEIIDEFPFFSYFLGDVHPHVLAMPFAFVALAIALNMYLRRDELKKRFAVSYMEFQFPPETFVLGVVVFGGLGFLNLWDFPWYVLVFAGAYLLRKTAEDGWELQRFWEFLLLVVGFGVCGIVAYLPFYLSFSSQAGGILPNIINPTRGAHLWIMFGTLFVPLFALLLYLLFKRHNRKTFVYGMLLAAAGTLVLFGFSVVSTYSAGRVIPEVGNQLFSFYQVSSLDELLATGFARRGEAIAGTLTLVFLVGVALAVIWPSRSEEQDESRRLAPSHRFAVLLVVVGGLLVIVPEFIFLQDMFSRRMNTIFKFYYQAWLMWAVAAAYGSAVLLGSQKNRNLRALFGVLFTVVLVVGLTYPVMAVNTRVSTFQASGAQSLELDGTANTYFLSGDEQTAAAWLKQAPLGTLVEAYGGSYSQYARFSMNSGQPAVLGWDAHEGQWRGDYLLITPRQEDIRVFYTARSWEQTQVILERYDVRYVVVGNLERSTYDVYEDKFIQHLTPVFQQGGITIYETAGWDGGL